MTKKLTVLVLALVLGLGTKVNAQTFKDVNNHWAKTPVEWATENNIFKGYPDGSFKPEKPITRAEYIKIISNLTGLNKTAYLNFKDVPKNAWYRHAMENLVGLTLIKNKESLNPSLDIDRDEAFGMLGQLLPYKEQHNKLNFADNFTIKRHRDIGVLKDLGIVSGDTNNRVNPYKKITRAEVATILYNMANKSIQVDKNELERARQENKFDFDFDESFDRSIYDLFNKKLMELYKNSDRQIASLFQTLDRQGSTFIYKKDKNFNIDTNNLISDLNRLISQSTYKMFMESCGVNNLYPSEDIKCEFTYNINKGDALTIINKINSIKMEAEGKSDYEKVKIIHDWIVNNTRYAYDEYLSKKYKITDKITAHMPLAIFKYGKGVCQSYAEAFNILAKEVGLSSILISGKAYGLNGLGGHAWNLVNIDGKIYHIDTTWDDPISSTGEDMLRYDYFLIDDTKMSKDHTWDKGKYPKANNGCLNDNIKNENDYLNKNQYNQYNNGYNQQDNYYNNYYNQDNNYYNRENNYYNNYN